MNWKKLLLIAVVTGGFAFASTPKSEAGLSVGVNFGAPYGYGGYGYGGYPGYCGYRYPFYYGPSYYAAPVIYYSTGGYYYWNHGRRVYCRRPHRFR